jgi:hypothetical protein
MLTFRPSRWPFATPLELGRRFVCGSGFIWWSCWYV